MSDPQRPHGLQPSRLLRPWDFPGKSTGVGCHCLLILKEMSPKYSLEGLMLNVKSQYFGHLTHFKRSWCWEGLRAGGKGDDRWWDGWMASPTQWTWVWVKSGSWWWTGRPGVLRFMGSQRVLHNWATELKWTDSLHWAPGTNIIIQCHTSITSQLKTKQCVICYIVFFLPWQLLKHEAAPKATSILSETDIELRSPANTWCTCG